MCDLCYLIIICIYYNVVINITLRTIVNTAVKHIWDHIEYSVCNLLFYLTQILCQKMTNDTASAHIYASTSNPKAIHYNVDIIIKIVFWLHIAIPKNSTCCYSLSRLFTITSAIELLLFFNYDRQGILVNWTTLKKISRPQPHKHNWCFTQLLSMLYEYPHLSTPLGFA